MARRVVDSYTSITQRNGSPAAGTHFGKHLGFDYAGPEGRPIKAPVSGVIGQSYLSGTAGNVYEIREDGNGRLHRIMHMKTRPFGVGTRVSEGQVIAYSGGAKGQKYSGTSSTGPHAHHDVRKAGTAWNASFNNYIDWEAIIGGAAPPPAPRPNEMPGVGSSIRLSRGVNRTTYKAGTTTVAGQIRPTDDSTFVYTVRGYDPKYPGRVIINSKSGGGNGVALALYYVSGARIEGWKVV